MMKSLPKSPNKGKAPNIKIVFRVTKEVNPHFRAVWTTDKTFNILKGGRSSFKSSVIALKVVREMAKYIQKDTKANVVLIRKTASSLHDSVYKKIQWALGKYGLTGQFKMTVKPLRIEHKRTGSTFYFYGQDDFEKLKSNDINDLISVWYEEATEFKNAEEFDQTNATFMRQQHELAKRVLFFWSYNPPRNPYHWINKWADGLKGADRYLVHESTYLDDELGFINDEMIAEIERIKENDYDYYRYLYLGEAVGLGTNVYNMNLVKVINQLPDDETIVQVGYSADTGHQTSATAVGLFGITNKQNVVLVDMYYYEPAGKVNKKAPSELSEDMREFIKSKGYVGYDLTIDSAEGALRNQYYKDFGERWTPVAKKKKHIMIDYTHDLLAQGRFFVIKNKNTDIFIEQMRQLAWNEKTMETSNPQPIAENDHSPDMFQYFVINHARRLGLRH